MHILSLLLFCSCKKAPLTPEMPSKKPLEQELLTIEQYISSYGANWGENFAFQGVVQIYQQDQLIYSHTSGFTDHEEKQPIDLDTNFRIASVSKTITAMATLSLVDDGLLQLTDTIQQHLPDYPDLGKDITIEQLLSHRSGIPNYVERPDITELMNKEWTPEQVPELFKNEALLFPAGSAFQYSNSGYVLLGLIIEKVSGVSYAEYIERNILEPAKMYRSQQGEETVLSNSALGYTQNIDETISPAQGIDLDLAFAAGSIRSTCPDLHRYSQAILHHEILSPTLTETMLQVHSTPEKASSGYGYGWGIDENIIGHSGSINGFGARIAYLQDKDIFICVLSNIDTFEVGAFAWDITSLIQKKEIKPHLERAIIPMSSSILDGFVSSWVLTEESRQLLVNKEVPAQYIEMLKSLEITTQEEKLIFSNAAMQAQVYPATEDILFSKMQGVTLTLSKTEDDTEKLHLSAMNGFVEVDYTRQKSEE